MSQKLFKLTSLNLNGIRSASSKGLAAWIEKSQPDCICVQEVKAQYDDVKDKFEEIAGMKGYFHFAEKKGYAGVGVYTKETPTAVIVGIGQVEENSPEFAESKFAEFNAEGRYVELRFDTPSRKFSIISCYYPSGSSGEARQQAKFRFLALIYPHLMQLKTEREFILCGDINIAHQEADLKNYKGNKKNSGFLPEERAWMTQLLHLEGCGLMDVYRLLQPDTTETCYTWWSNRGQAYANNVGWRLDYHLATPKVARLAKREEIYKTERFSDHAPMTISYDFSGF